MPRVGQCGHSFCEDCILRLGLDKAICPICRAPFGAERPPNILVKGLIQQYFPMEYERRRLQQPAVAVPGPLVLKPRGGRGAHRGDENIDNSNAMVVVMDGGGGGDDQGLSRRQRLWRHFVVWIRPLWPWVRFAAPVFYPVFVLCLWWWMFRNAQRRRTRRFVLFE